MKKINWKKEKKSAGNKNQNNVIIPNNQNQKGIGVDNEVKNSNKNKKEKEKHKLEFNDYDLNSLEYKIVKINDKREWAQYYFSLVKDKNIIFFAFCPVNKDGNSRIIRLCIFCLSYCIYYAANFLFFTNEIIHEIYENKGEYDFKLFLPKIMISFAASYVITELIKIIFLSERNILKIKIQNTWKEANQIVDNVKRILLIKYIIFFIIGLGFLIFFWLLLSSFGAVYPNTQLMVFKNTIISFAISLVYPFIISLLPGVLRCPALASDDSETMYNISKFLQLL